MPPIFPYMIPGFPTGTPALPPPIQVGPPGGQPPSNGYDPAAFLASLRAGGAAGGSPYLSPLQALFSGAANGYGAAGATRQQQAATASQAAAQASLRLQLGALANQGKTDVAGTRAGSADRATAARQFSSLYASNSRASSLSDEQYNGALTTITKGIGDGSLTPELGGMMIEHIRGGRGGGAPAAGAGGGLPGGPPALASPPSSEPLTDSSGAPLPGQPKAAGDGQPGGRGFGLDGIRQSAPPQGQGAALPPPAGTLPPPGSVGILNALRASDPANSTPAPPPPGPAALVPPGTPPGLAPSAPAALPPQTGAPAGQLGAPNIFAGLGPSPLGAAKIADLSAQGKHLGNQDEINFRTAVGLLPPPQQYGFAKEWNARNGTNYSPGAAVPLPPGIQGPPGQTPAYAPNLLQGADIDAKRARANLDTTLAGLDGKKFELAKLTQQQQAQYQNRTLALKARGLSDAEATRQAQLEIQRGQLALGQGRLALDTSKAQNGGGGGAKDLLGQVDKEIARVTKPGRATFDLNTGSMVPGVSLASTPDGAAYLRHLQNRRTQALQGQGAGGPVVPGRTPGFAIRAGSSVRSVAAPPAGLGTLPGFGPGAGALRPARPSSAPRSRYSGLTDAQVLAEFARQKGRR